MKMYLLAPVLALATTFAVDISMPEAKKQGELLGKSGSRTALEQAKTINQDDLMPLSGPEFDPHLANRMVQDQITPKTNTLDFLLSQDVQRNIRHLNPEEYLFKRSDSIVDSHQETSLEISTIDESSHFTLHTCQEVGAPYPIELYRTLQLDVLYEPEAQQEARHCLGHQRHQKFMFKSDAEDWVQKQTDKQALDAGIRTCTSVISGGGLFEKYTATLSWEHHENVSNCDHYKKLLVTKPEHWEQRGERWTYDDPILAEQSRGVDYRLIGHECIDSSPRTIHGKEVCKPCWRERLSFLYSYPETKQCAFLKERNCTEVKRHCVMDSDQGCAIWEVTYRCFEKLRLRSVDKPQDIYGLASEEWGLDYEPNTSFSAVATNLALFENLKTELESQNSPDATKAQLFTGKTMSCAKNIADKVLYDCCFSFGGIATDLKLSQCSAQEIALGELRLKGLCHYVGKHEEKFLDLWKSRDEHVFCCFSSKLARVFHEEAREQLHMPWGSAEKPNCRGFYLAELQNVDFTKLDLSEVYNNLSHDLEQRLQQKLKNIEGHLKDRLRSDVENANT